MAIDINTHIREIENRCAQRGEMLAAVTEHTRALNGDITEIRDILKTISDDVKQTREAVAMARGVWLVASMIVGAIIAYAAQMLPSLP